MVIIAGLIFEFAVQPALVNIDPMFADQDLPVGEATGRGPETPAELAGYITIFVVGYILIVIKDKIKDIFDNS